MAAQRGAYPIFFCEDSELDGFLGIFLQNRRRRKWRASFQTPETQSRHAERRIADALPIFEPVTRPHGHAQRWRCQRSELSARGFIGPWLRVGGRLSSLRARGLVWLLSSREPTLTASPCHPAKSC
jgi:hypothetical protein